MSRGANVMDVPLAGNEGKNTDAKILAWRKCAGRLIFSAPYDVVSKFSIPS
jgi:hypothetical protein